MPSWMYCIYRMSSLLAGSISDKELTRQSGIIDLLEPGNSVMPDKGFLIGDILADKNVSLNVLPFQMQQNQFSKEEVEETQEVA